MQISATDAVTTDVNGNPTGVNAVVFGIVNGGTLWEHNIGFGDKDAQGMVSEADLNVNWRNISTGQFTDIAAAAAFLPTRTQNSGETGVPANPLTLLPTDPIVFGVMAGSGNVWEHNANPGGSMAGPSPEGMTDANWSMISRGDFTHLAAVVVPTVTTGANPTLGAGFPVLYGILSGSGNVWEHNITFSAGAAPEGTTDANSALISTSRVLGDQRDHPDQSGDRLDGSSTVDPVLFASDQVTGNLSEHNDSFNPAMGETVTDANWVKISNGVFEQFGATLHATANGGLPALLRRHQRL